MIVKKIVPSKSGLREDEGLTRCLEMSKSKIVVFELKNLRSNKVSRRERPCRWAAGYFQVILTIAGIS